MEIYDFSKYDKVYLIGDIHGEFNTLRNSIRNSSSMDKDSHLLDKLRMSLNSKKKVRMPNTMLNNSIIIVAGDCGFGFHKREYYNEVLKPIDEQLQSINAHLFFVRGNHDDPSYFNGKEIATPNITAIPDYSVIVTANENILCVGGAISVDRTWRISQENHINRFSQTSKKKLYWENEAPIYAEDELQRILDSKIDINFVVTHSAPSFVKPTKMEKIDAWEESDENLINDVNQERQTFDKVYNFLINNNMPLKGWYYGHFHQDLESKSKDYIPFRGLSNSYHFHSIYEVTENDGLNESKISLSLGNGGRYGLPQMPQALRAHHNDNYEPLRMEHHDLNDELARALEGVHAARRNENPLGGLENMYGHNGIERIEDVDIPWAEDNNEEAHVDTIDDHLLRAVRADDVELVVNNAEDYAIHLGNAEQEVNIGIRADE